VRILYAATRFDFGQPAEGLSFEHYNFFESLTQAGHEILYFDFLSLLHERGRAAMNRRLRQVVDAERPDLLFSVLVRDELDPEIIRRISEESSTVTLNWFCDDHWRFESFTRRWAPNFNWVVTTAASALAKYRAIGYSNVIKSQWACNEARYRPLDLPRAYDVTFVGASHGNRRFVLHALSNAGIHVRAWGKGWAAGRLRHDEMIRVFNQSRINLNLSNASATRGLPGRGLDLMVRCVEASPARPAVREAIARRLALVRESLAPRGDFGYADQIKGRNFEVPGCSGFLLTGRADNLEDFYIPDREIGCFRDTHELIQKVQYYLRNAEEREAIAAAGYQRTLREHTYRHRFAAIFRRMGLSDGRTAGTASTAGSVEEIH
jgi:spore maturation protein CgeB